MGHGRPWCIGAIPGRFIRYFTTSPVGMRDRASQPVSVTSTVWPLVIARLRSLSNMMMWMKNTMPGAAGSGLPW